MLIRLIRTHYETDYTAGVLWSGGQVLCHTLEPTWRGDGPELHKVDGRTAIPCGTYRVIIDHSVRFNRRLPHVLGVKGFSGIRIHPGNTAQDTRGCLLVGQTELGGRLTGSRAAFTKLLNLLENEKETILHIERHP